MPAGDGRGGARDALLLLAGFVLIGLALYAPVMNAGWLSDDLSVIAGNPYVQELSLANLRVVADPYGAATAYAFNYSPVHLLLHAVTLPPSGGAGGSASASSITSRTRTPSASRTRKICFCPGQLTLPLESFITGITRSPSRRSTSL